ncbi:helix-turn-helix domain-containing protein [Enterovibrio nigricans]|uniref:Helix-turn-helix n=1 Tax=Enterovibrio nigricans DSM 22720 TaxID=1121868 RepID=A0A1T4W4X5_9GAMM|nr:helix-turn-helix transcriptional regulator [Enterovibrio nigricans]PKF48704.1 XRE family transcriptional regulator [Enterovibrio nigricans]SKA72257.1 Helix-turn-helix [Enterovibrio nigricans DSM 22720]
MDYGKRLKAIRLEEGLSQSEFSQLTDIPTGTIQNYEQGKRTLNEENLSKITSNSRIFKYTLWLVTGKTAYESGQICPAYSTQEKCGLDVPQDAKRA